MHPEKLLIKVKCTTAKEYLKKTKCMECYAHIAYSMLDVPVQDGTCKSAVRKAGSRMTNVTD